MKYFVLVLFLISFGSSLEVDFDCPNDIFEGEEFECLIEISDGEGKYDVKIDLDGERNSVVKVFNDGEWKSGYYYLNDFIEGDDKENIRLTISEDGNWDGVLKLRQGDKREFFDIEIEVEDSREIEKDEEVLEEVITKEVSLNKGDKVLVLGEDDADGLVYASKEAKIIDWLPYGFSIFLIFIIIVLLWERF